jgi:predicted transcriptional regulator
MQAPRSTPSLDQRHTLRQAAHIMIDTGTHNITVTAKGKPIATLTIQDILDAVRDGHNTSTTTLQTIVKKQPLSPEKPTQKQR